MSEWIRVDDSIKPESVENFPQYSVDVLLYDGQHIFMGYFHGGTAVGSVDFEYNTVTHWQPLPEPPQ